MVKLQNSSKTEYDFYKNHEITLPKKKYWKRGLSGLINLGNTCFLNSIIQCLSNTIKLTDYFLSNEYKNEDTEDLNKNKKEYPLLKSYVNLLKHIWHQNELLKPKSFFEKLSKDYVKKYAEHRQQDSHEFLMFLLDYLHKGLNYEIDVQIHGEVKDEYDSKMKDSIESWKTFYKRDFSEIVSLFYGMNYTSVECKSCKNETGIFEPFNCLSLNIINSEETSNLYDSFDNYFSQKENVDDWKCDKCKKDTSCYKTSELWNIPNYLIIHLKRFDNNGKKNTNFVDFPLEDLDITKYVSQWRKDKNNYIYSLYAINYHSGTSKSGHYWSSCKNLDNNWYLFNDGNVSKYNSKKHIITQDAYILFYYRKFIK